MSLFMSRRQDDEYPLTDNPNHSYILSTSSLNTPVNGSTTQSGYNSGDETAAESESNRPLPSAVDIEARINHAKTDEPPYHVFTKRQKWNFVYLVSLAGSFSPLSSNIYFPAINTISLELGVSESLIALTITVYMVVQGIAPSIFGAVSDTSGRRLTFAIVLTIYTAANLALSFTANYPMLLALRGLQAAGSAATISISTGVIADMASPGERGSFIGTNAGIRYVEAAVAQKPGADLFAE